MRKIPALIIACSLVACAAARAAAAPGDAYVYRILNGYNNEERGNLSYRVDKTDADRVEVAVTTDPPGAGVARTDIYTKDGNWLRHPLANHGQLREYEFSQALQIYAPPNDTSGSWSLRVDALVPATGTRASVRVDGEVVGSERVTVPAGTFDTIKIRRRIYAGDWDGFQRETQILEYDWYSPALGRSIKSDSKSSWQDTSRCGRGVCTWFRGDWNVLELAAINAPAR